jgi:hypothetical protein
LKYTRIVATTEGSSCFVDAELALSEASIAEGVPPLLVSAPIELSAAVFLEHSEANDWRFHTTPTRVLVILMSGKILAETGDGDRREFGVGDVISVEDTTGKGHLSRPLTADVRMAMLLVPEPTES